MSGRILAGRMTFTVCVLIIRISFQALYTLPSVFLLFSPLLPIILTFQSHVFAVLSNDICVPFPVFPEWSVPEPRLLRILRCICIINLL